MTLGEHHPLSVSALPHTSYSDPAHPSPGAHLRASSSRQFTPSVEERNIWAHHVFNTGGRLRAVLGKYGLKRNWDLTREQVSGGKRCV